MKLFNFGRRKSDSWLLIMFALIGTFLAANAVILSLNVMYMREFRQVIKYFNQALEIVRPRAPEANPHSGPL